MTPIEPSNENSMPRSLQPDELASGARSELIITGETPLVGEKLDNLLREIDSLPLEADPDPDLSTTYRRVLYGPYSNQ